MRQLRYLVIHCTDTPEGKEFNKEDIIRWHTMPKHLGGRGWRRPGYSDVIKLDGTLENILPFNQDDQVDSWEISNGVKGINGVSRHVVYVGGRDQNENVSKDTRTAGQLKSLETYVKCTILRHSEIEVMGHNQAPNASKACPSFDVPEWLESIGVESKNIYKS